MKRRRILKGSVIFVAILSLWALVAPFLAERLTVARPLHRADVILVLAGGSRTYSQRAETAAALHRQGVASSVLLTDAGMRAGWSQEEQTTIPYVELSRRRLIAEGVPEAEIEILPRKVSGTIEEAELLRTLATERRWKSVLIITSTRHTRRALWTFERVFAAAGLETRIGIAGAPNGDRTPPDSCWWLTPSGWTDVAGEYVKAVYYFFAY